MKYLAPIFLGYFFLGCQYQDEPTIPKEIEIESDALEAVPGTERISKDSIFELHEELVAGEGCFPEPSERFQSWIGTDSIWIVMESSPHVIYTYLAFHFDSLENRQVTETDDFWGPIAWNQKFSNGFYYERLRYPEAGSDGLLRTSCSDRKAFYHTFLLLTATEENSWNKDSTKYEPEGAGCYYEIELEEDQTYSVSWYCGC